MPRVAWMIGLLAFLATTAAAEVVVRRLADGTPVMSNGGRSRAVNGSGTSGSNGARMSAEWAVERRLDLDEVIERHAEAERVDPDLVHAIIQVESDYDADARSHQGAVGLMQLMPATARELAVSDPFDAEQNVRGGTRYLRLMLEQFDDRLDWALAAYNAGPEAVARYHGVPPYAETRSYVDRVLGIYYGDPRPAAAERPQRGRPVYLSRDPAGRLVMTTTPPRER